MRDTSQDVDGNNNLSGAFPAENEKVTNEDALSSPAAHRDQLPGANINQALARGLHILQMLVTEGSPMTATAVAKRLGMHQTSASRILATMIDVGYVRRDHAGLFEPDYGVLALASSTTRLPLITKPRPAVDRFIEKYPELNLTMCMLWRDELIYLLRVQRTSEPVIFWSGAFPINISSPGLRLLVDLPDDEAISILRVSRERLGWGGRPETVPETEEELLSTARGLVVDEVLTLKNWYREDHIGGAIPIETPEPHPVALAIVDNDGHLTTEKLTVLLHQVRRDIERCFAD